MIMIRKSIIALPARLHPLKYTITAVEKAMEKVKKCLIFRAFCFCAVLDGRGVM